MIELLRNYLQAIDVRVCVATLMILIVPTTFCFSFWFKSPFVRSPKRQIATVVLLTLIGWVMVVIGCLIRPGMHEGSSMFLVLFGWAYTWIIGLPIMLMSLFLRGLSQLRRWRRRKMTNQTMSLVCPTWLVAALLAGTMVLCSVIMGVNPAKVWRTWSGGQYRLSRKDGFVHVQIRESGGVSDIVTEVPACFPCEIVPVCSELLRMKSLFNSFDYIVRKVDGKWTCL